MLRVQVGAHFPALLGILDRGASDRPARRQNRLAEATDQLRVPPVLGHQPADQRDVSLAVRRQRRLEQTPEPALGLASLGGSAELRQRARDRRQGYVALAREAPSCTCTPTDARTERCGSFNRS